MRGDGGTQIITKRALLARIEALEAEVKALKVPPPPAWAPQVLDIGRLRVGSADCADQYGAYPTFQGQCTREWGRN